MKFKILKGTKLFDTLMLVCNEIDRCNKLAFDLVRELGYKQMRGKDHVLAGGISSIVIQGDKPDGWKKAYKDLPNEYFPSKLKSNKELLDRIDALPVVEYEALNAPLNYDWSNHTTRSVSFHPGIIWKDEYILVNVPSHTKYEPVADMIEILESDFVRLSK